MKLTKDAIRREADETALVGGELLVFDELDSTNTYLKTHWELPDGTAVIADCQSAGRGRLSRTFLSPAGKGLYLSVLFRTPLPEDALLSLTALAGVAAARAIEDVSGLAVGIKWPNDLHLGGKKCAGILAERCVMGETSAAVVGIGINVSQTAEDFPGDLAETAVSLCAAGAEVDRAALAAALLRELDAVYARLRAGEQSAYLAEYRARCENVGREVRLLAADGTERRALVTGIDARYGLEVEIDGEREVIRTGEISLRPL
ncbi:MAG: biotin--[Oscillibacter sp.]|nr:biotin--[acetyl-CoA-carboxylase] ligase [Oscillibacter sp.]